MQIFQFYLFWRWNMILNMVRINWDSLYSLTISLNSINLLRDLGCLSEGGGAFLFQLAHLGEVVVA